MLTKEDDVEIHALAARGWTKAAIARHTGRDRKTIQKYLARPVGAPGRERETSCLEPFGGYVEARFVDDPHVDATVLHRELVDAGFDRSYPTLVRELRRLELRPVCLVCQHRRGTAPTVEIEHPAGEEIQWDWLELPDTPWAEPAYVLVGALSHSGRFRGVFCEQMTFGHLAEAAHTILVALGGTARVWRTDRMATIVVPGTDRLTVVLGEHRQALRRGDRGLPAAAGAAQGRGREGDPVPDELVVAHRARHDACAGAGEQWSLEVADRRARPDGTTVGEIGAIEPLRGLAALAYPAVITVTRKASRSALVPFDGNKYSVPPAHAGRTVTVLARVTDPQLRIVSAAGEIVASHRRAPRSAGQTIRTAEHAAMLEQAVLAAFTTDHACRRKVNRPPGPEALTELARLTGHEPPPPAQVVSLADYQQLADATTANRQTAR
jgi:hypothetical protein